MLHRSEFLFVVCLLLLKLVSMSFYLQLLLVQVWSRLHVQPHCQHARMSLHPAQE
jgi:hypothetical protein